MLTREATGANCSVFDLTQPGFRLPNFPLGHQGGYVMDKRDGVV